MRKRHIGIIVLAATAFLTACGGKTNIKNALVTSIEIAGNGGVTQVIVEDFSESYYDEEELKATAEEEVTTFNSANGDSLVKLVKVEKEDDNVRAILSYDTASAYEAFNDETLRYGTGDALADQMEGYVVDENRNEVLISQIEDLAEVHVIVTGTKAHIRTPYKIAYTSDGVTPVSDTEVDTSTATDEVVYIIMVK